MSVESICRAQNHTTRESSDDPGEFSLLFALNMLECPADIHGVLPDRGAIFLFAEVVFDVMCNRDAATLKWKNRPWLDARRFSLQQNLRPLYTELYCDRLTDFGPRHTMAIQKKSVGAAQVVDHPLVIFEADLRMISADIFVLYADLAVVLASYAE